MLTFAEYLNNATETNQPECAFLSELTISPGAAKVAAVGILAKIAQLNRTISQNRNATADAKALSSELLWVATLVALSIGALNDATAKGTISRWEAAKR